MKNRKAGTGFKLFLICEALARAVSERLRFPDNHINSHANKK
jgi:hypothetical protein